MRRVLEKCGASIVGQTKNLVPADRKLYSLRDRTATVENPYLICASIMSKKLAAGLDALVIDVKTGSGAFLRDEDQARYLAALMVETGERAGTRTVTVLTDMSQPLGRMAGNWVEVAEAVELLRGERPALSEDLRRGVADPGRVDGVSGRQGRGARRRDGRSQRQSWWTDRRCGSFARWWRRRAAI